MNLIDFDYLQGNVSPARAAETGIDRRVWILFND
jgi:hypothetical protein